MKVTVKETPSEQVINAASQIHYVTDSKGRKLGLKQPDFLDEFRIVEAVGGQTAENTTYMAMLNPLLFVVEIDGHPVLFPASKAEAELLIKRVGREGFTAVLKGITKHFALDQAELDDKIKKGDGIPV